MTTTLVALILAVPALAVHGWAGVTFPGYRGMHLAGDVVFALAFCGLLATVARLRLLSRASVVVTTLVYVAWLLLVLSEGVSYYLQGTSFNDRFFGNFDIVNLTTGIHAFPWVVGGSTVALVVMTVLAALLFWRLSRRRQPLRGIGPRLVAGGIVVVLIVVPLLAGSTPRRLIGYLNGVQQSNHLVDTPEGQAVRKELDLNPVAKAALVAKPGKNLVFLYLESLERIYWDPKVFPGLTPNLDRLRKEGLEFTGVETFTGATYTIAGMFASQCGMPFFSSPFADLDVISANDTSALAFRPQLVCLGDVLHAAGYRQVYMGGAPITYSRKGLFYRLHGFDLALGEKELEAAHDGKLGKMGWGLHDTSLFPLLIDRYRKLEKTGKPFNLTAITMDTHPVTGHPSPGCPVYAAKPDNTMLHAVHCTDYLVGKFIKQLQAEPDWKNTVVVIMSDHLMMRNVAQPLYPPDYHRKLALLVLNAGHGQRPVRMYSMDVAPTVLDLMGVDTNATFMAGKDRSAPGADPNPLTDTPTSVAVLRNELWSLHGGLTMCSNDTLVKRSGAETFDMGGLTLNMNFEGDVRDHLDPKHWMTFFTNDHGAALLIAAPEDMRPLLAKRGAHGALLFHAVMRDGSDSPVFSVDWLGAGGARAHIADVATLKGLKITSPDCAALIKQADAAKAGKKLDFSQQFQVVTQDSDTP